MSEPKPRAVYTRELSIEGLTWPDERTMDVVASTEAVDSHGTIVRSDWRLKRYEANPVVLYSHDSGELPIGRAENVRVDGGKLRARIHFATEDANPKAEQIRKLMQQRILRGISVRFWPEGVAAVTHEGREVFALSKNELLEISVTPVPSNPEALADMRARAVASATKEARVAITTDPSLIPGGPLAALAAVDLPAARSAACEVTGLATDVEAHARLAEWRVAGEKLAAVEARAVAAETQLAALTVQLGALEREALIVGGEAAHKVTPALRAFLAKQPTEVVRGFLESAPVIAVLAARPVNPPPVEAGASAPDAVVVTEGKINGRGWDDYVAKGEFDFLHDLKVRDLAAYRQLFAARSARSAS